MGRRQGQLNVKWALAGDGSAFLPPSYSLTPLGIYHQLHCLSNISSVEHKYVQLSAHDKFVQMCICHICAHVHMTIVEFQLKNLVKMRDSTIVQSSVCAVFLKKSTDFTIGVARSMLVLSPLSLALWLSGSLTPWRRRHRCRVPVADMWLHRQEGLAE